MHALYMDLFPGKMHHIDLVDDWVNTTSRATALGRNVSWDIFSPLDFLSELGLPIDERLEGFYVCTHVVEIFCLDFESEVMDFDKIALS